VSELRVRTRPIDSRRDTRHASLPLHRLQWGVGVRGAQRWRHHRGRTVVWPAATACPPLLPPPLMLTRWRWASSGARSRRHTSPCSSQNRLLLEESAANRRVIGITLPLRLESIDLDPLTHIRGVWRHAKQRGPRQPGQDDLNRLRI